MDNDNSLLQKIKLISKEFCGNKSPTTYSCDLCQDVGFVFGYNDFGYQYAKKCVCKLKKEQNDRIKRSGLSMQIENCSFDAFKTQSGFQKVIKKKAIDFCEQHQYPAFFIGGQVGVGKTHICTAICKHFLDKGYSVKYIKYREVMPKLKSLANMDSEYNDIITPICNYKVLYIDDLFKTKRGDDISKADIEHTFRIIDYRYTNKMVTIFSSEFLLGEIINFDEAIGSRIKQMAGEFVVNINNDIKKNYRLL